MSELDRFRSEWKSEVEQKLHSHDRGDVGSSSTRSLASSSRTPGTKPKSTTTTGSGANTKSQSNQSSPVASSQTVITDSFRAERPEDVFHNKDLTNQDLNALEAFEKAVDSEHNGKLSDAVKYYRDAFKLNERVDKLYREKYYSAKSHTKSKPRSTNDQVSKSTTDIIKALDNLILTPENEESPCPIVKIPVEILAEIFKYLALDDLSSFTKCTYTCKKFAYIGYTTQNIWMGLCKQAYSTQHYTEDAVEELCNGDDILAVKKYWSNSWRKMYLERPRVRFDGVYISTCNYLRPGVGQTWNAPLHMVTYYRYIRFYEDGNCINLLTTSEPSDVVPVFNRQITGNNHDARNNRRQQQQPSIVYQKEDGTVLSRPKGITNGTWKINSLDGKILIESEGSVDRYTFYMNMQIRSSGNNRHNKLKWIKFWSINKLTQAYGEFTLKHDKSFFFVQTKKNPKVKYI